MMGNLQYLEQNNGFSIIDIIERENSGERTGVARYIVNVNTQNILDEDRLFDRMYIYTGDRLLEEVNACTDGYSKY
ncbi:MAG: hypothetical protein FWH04_00125 [Oscillospiraceae bacterium]|nr:hypothetical protein [Oscillospiraceae bacterium]